MTGGKITYLLDARTVTPHFPGIGRYVANLAPALAAQLDAQEHLLILHAPQAQPQLASISSPQVRLFATGISPFALQQQWAIPRLLRQIGPVDLYHSTYLQMPYGLRMPAVLTFYDLIPLQHPETVSRRARLFFQLLLTMALASASQVVSISEAARHDLLARFKVAPERVTTTPLAADARFRTQSAEGIARVRAAYSLPEEMVLYVGINKPHKNLVRLVQAFAHLRRQGSGAVLVLAGPWDERYPEVKSEIKALGLGDCVRILGRVEDDDLPALYAAATVFVLPSQYEGFGLPVLEAMACGTAVACSNTSSLPEIAGGAALTFDPFDVGALAQAQQRLLGDASLRHDMVQAGMAQAARFSWANTARATLAVYRRACTASSAVA